MFLILVNRAIEGIHFMWSIGHNNVKIFFWFLLVEIWSGQTIFIKIWRKRHFFYFFLFGIPDSVTNRSKYLQKQAFEKDFTIENLSGLVWRINTYYSLTTYNCFIKIVQMYIQLFITLLTCLEWDKLSLTIYTYKYACLNLLV